MVGGQQGQQSFLPALLATPDLMTRAFMTNPFSFAQAMSQEMDRLFSGGDSGALSAAGQTSGRGQTGRGLSQWAPPMEVVQRMPLGPKHSIAVVRVGDRLLRQSAADHVHRRLQALSGDARGAGRGPGPRAFTRHDRFNLIPGTALDVAGRAQPLCPRLSGRGP